jgi:hypothetical protein
MAVLLTNDGGGQVGVVAQGVRGDDATEALADLLMGPGGIGTAAALPGLIGVVVRRGIDIMWMAQPPIEVAGSGDGTWEIAVDNADGAEVTAFSADDTRDLLTRLRAAYGVS